MQDPALVLVELHPIGPSPAMHSVPGFLALRQINTYTNLVSSANLLRMHSILSSRSNSLIQINLFKVLPSALPQKQIASESKQKSDKHSKTLFANFWFTGDKQLLAAFRSRISSECCALSFWISWVMQLVSPGERTPTRRRRFKSSPQPFLGPWCCNGWRQKAALTQQRALSDNNRIGARLPRYEILFTNGLNALVDILHEAPLWPQDLSDCDQHHFQKAPLCSTQPCWLLAERRGAHCGQALGSRQWPGVQEGGRAVREHQAVCFCSRVPRSAGAPAAPLACRGLPSTTGPLLKHFPSAGAFCVSVTQMQQMKAAAR